MKKNLLPFIFSLLFLAGNLQAQTIHPEYLDGAIWFKIKDKYPLSMSISKNGNKMDNMNMIAADFAYTKQIALNYEINKLSRPFHMVKNDLINRVYRLEFANPADVDAIIRELEMNEAIEYAEKIPLLKHCLTPNDPSYNSSTQWGLFKIQAAQAWNITTGSTNVVVAIVDDAVEITHSDLAANIWVNTDEIASNGIDDDGNGHIDDRQGWDVASNDNNPNPPNSTFDHGTHVAGIVSAKTNNSIGVASIGFNIKLMAIKSTTQATLVTNGYEGIVYAYQNGANVINMSWGGSGTSTTAQNIIADAQANGCILVAAAGNDDVSTVFYPAGYNGVVAVASSTTNDAKSGFSNYGTWIDVTAPGSSIYSTIPGNSYDYKQGTSMASPMVAGLMGLVQSVNPGMPDADVINCVLSTADNIDAVNSSYIGELGSGRINAFDAVSCAATTLNLPPVADFTANYTTIPAGASVNFTDLSVYNPTSWSWTFTGGTPASFNGQNPPAIVYNTAGTYSVSLTATNGNGNDVETKTGYITVTVNSGCDTLGDHPWNPVYTPSLYTLTPATAGYLAGTNNTGDRAKAEYYNAAPYTYLTGLYLWFGAANDANPNETITVFVKNGTGMTVGANLTNGTKTVRMGDIMADVAGNFLTYVEFDPPVVLPASKEIFVGMDVTSLNFVTGVEDLGLVTTDQNELATGYEQLSTSVWQNYSTRFGVTFGNYINPIVTDVPTVVTFTQTATTVCAGNSISFDATGSTAQDTLLWSFVGGSPYNSNNMQQTVFYNTAGSYRAYLQVIGGSCSGYAIDSVDITVLANPNVTVTATPSTVCPGNNSALSASGATSYTWSPSTFLSATTGANVNCISPTSSITYDVTGTTGSCSKSTSITITLDNTVPTADYLVTEDSICAGSSVTFNGGVSNNASTYAWTFTGGDIGSSTASGPTVSYATPGNFTFDLNVTNNCSQTDNITGTIVVLNCLGIENNFATEEISAFVNHPNGYIQVNFNLPSNARLDIKLVNAIGQNVYFTNEEIASGNQIKQIDISGIASGIYFLRVTDGQRNFVVKFVK